MFVLKSRYTADLAASNAEVLRLRQELKTAHDHVMTLSQNLARAQDATEDERATLADVARNLHVVLGQSVDEARDILEGQIAAARHELAVERGKREVFERQLMLAQKDAEWLRTVYNLSNNERTAVLSQRLGAAVPAAQFSVPMQPPPDARTGLSDGGPVGAGLPGNVQEYLDSFAGSMEDMGDAAAGQAGITHDADGNAIFGPIATE